MNPVQRLKALYARLPEVNCQGHCQEYCGALILYPLEFVRLRRSIGGPIFNDRAVCNALSANGRCSAYEVRPFICRIWGAIKGQPCRFGCVPDRELDELEIFELHRDLVEICFDAGLKGTAESFQDYIPMGELLRVKEAIEGIERKALPHPTQSTQSGGCCPSHE